MQDHDPQHQHNTLWWITSLAISVTCCAVLFVVFAGYVVSMKEDLALARLRLDMTDQRLSLVNSELENLYHRAAPMVTPTSAAPAATAAEPTPPAAATEQSTVNPSAAPTAPTGTVPGTTSTIGTTAPASVTPAEGTPTAVPTTPSTR